MKKNLNLTDRELEILNILGPKTKKVSLEKFVLQALAYHSQGELHNLGIAAHSLERILYKINPLSYATYQDSRSAKKNIFQRSGK
jgi:diphthamide synthase subunit DPH2